VHRHRRSSNRSNESASGRAKTKRSLFSRNFEEAVDNTVRVRDLSLKERVNGMLYWTYDGSAASSPARLINHGSDVAEGVVKQ
jgi:hypothetical protein